jgi:hypothetical protein
MTRQNTRAATVHSIPNRRPLHALVAAAMFATAAFAIPAVADAQPQDDTIEWRPERAPAGPTLIVVGIAEQRAQIYRNGVRIGSTPVSTGKKGHATPTGLFSILEKKRKHNSNLYNNAPMPNMQRLTWDGIALHAGKIPGYPASHGCIRLPHDVSDKLFDVTSRGTLVAVVDSFPDTAVFDMADISATAGKADPHSKVTLPSPAAGSYGPVSVVLSTRDRAIVVMRNGIEVGRAPVEVDPSSLAGERLYVSRVDNHWEELATSVTAMGNPRDAFAAGQLRVDPAFGQKLEPLLVPGTTVLITDQPIDGGTSYASAEPPAVAPLAGDIVSSVDAAP